MRPSLAITVLLTLLCGGTTSYAECLRGNCKNGNGAFKYDYDIYEGDFKGWTRHGHGTLTFADGGSYSGEWKQGRPDGAGTKMYANGDIYVGNFKYGKRNGHGVFEWMDGTKSVSYTHLTLPTKRIV